MSLEVELKFPVNDIQAVRRKLEGHGASWKERSFEQNAVFDTAERSLWQQGLLLRLRLAGGRAVICLKRPPAMPVSHDVKAFEELQTGVEDPEELRGLLSALGYIEAFRYEKFREKWLLCGCLVCLDQLPFGRYVELEGSREAIFGCAEILDLSIQSGTPKTYHQLNREKRAEKGLPPEESFIFPDQERDALIERDDFFC